ncbi:PEK protein kinase [Helicocarpus griseus UAMH5409]|uniref:PEK protein kinase n=1 Tax=Helicocarpus griseus UAMH5409 TaxID=1447875 RepID=A0A2B7X3K6_9EURO|nr:PEK protein kinase [Helicocarpus griseus UAMH5409]
MSRSSENTSSSAFEFLSGEHNAGDTAGSAPENPKKVPTDTSTESLENSPPSHEYGASHDEIEMSTRVDQGDIPELNAEGQAAMMTAALLEFYCYSRAADILNGQPGSHGRYTRDSPEAKFLGRHLYAYKSQFLSNHGILPGGVDGDDWESSRQYYRDNLDVLGMAALGDADLSARSSRPPSRGAIGQSSGALDIGQLQNRLEGLDIENIQNFTPQRPSRPTPQRRITDKPHAEGDVEPMPPNFADLVRHSRIPFPHLPINMPVLYPQAMNLNTSRYATEFEEEAMIGKGSYGAVYRARHHVDDQVYAVKKIPLGKKRLQQLQEGGLRALDKILKEIRTLARLEHPNVVRYFGAWAECSNSPIIETPSSGFPIGSRGMEDRHQALPSPSLSSGNNDELSFSIVFEDSSHGIVFEKSSANHESAGDGTEPSSDSPSARRDKRKFFHRNSGKGDTGDDEVESLPRHFNFPTRGQTTTDSETNEDIFSDGLGNTGSGRQIGRKIDLVKPGPVLTLHIQMSLHPLSLAKYLTPKPGTSASHTPQHCYHLIPSLKILLGVLSGVEYLHATGIVHRDLKPANIFLSPAGPQDNVVCRTCEKTGEKRAWYTVPRIGDFGLVAEISQYGENKSHFDSPFNGAGARARPVGTEFYRPPIISSRHTQNRNDPDNDDEEHIEIQDIVNVDESLDIFALGVILFELLYKFETRMERQMTLCDLTCSPNTQRKQYQHRRTLSNLIPTLPVDFARKVNCSGVFKNESDEVGVLEKLAGCIKGMLDPDSQRRWPCKDVKRCLNEILSMCEDLA